MNKSTNKESEQLIAYCGLCCLDCHSFQQKIPDLARDLRKMLRQSKYNKFADFISQSNFGKAFKNYEKNLDPKIKNGKNQTKNN